MIFLDSMALKQACVMVWPTHVLAHVALIPTVVLYL